VRNLPNLLGAVALLLCAVGVLIFVEVIRPFRDMAIDGPIALSLWGIGAALAVSCLFLKGRSITLSIISLLANVVLLLAALALIWALSHSNFAWH
jgi:hypothetical protein